jgi:SsrA-binding protein
MKKNDPLIAKNKKAYFDYEIIESWAAWIELKWYETKSARAKHANLKGSYVVVMSNEIYVKGMHITAWKSLSYKGSVETDRVRKLFLHRKTIDYLVGKIKEGWYTIIPLELYFKWSLIKLRMALAKGKKAHQKKQVLKERAMDKQAKQSMKKYI